MVASVIPNGQTANSLPCTCSQRYDNRTRVVQVRVAADVSFAVFGMTSTVVLQLVLSCEGMMEKLVSELGAGVGLSVGVLLGLFIWKLARGGHGGPTFDDAIKVATTWALFGSMGITTTIAVTTYGWGWVLISGRKCITDGFAWVFALIAPLSILLSLALHVLSMYLFREHLNIALILPLEDGPPVSTDDKP